MTALREAAALALEVLEQLQGGCTDSGDGTFEAITVWCPEVIDALRAALSAPADTVLWIVRHRDDTPSTRPAVYYSESEAKAHAAQYLPGVARVVALSECDALSAPAGDARQLVSVSSISVERMIAACLPGGASCDPQQVADAIRGYCNAWPAAGEPPGQPAAVAETPAWGGWYSDEYGLLRFAHGIERAHGITPAAPTTDKEQ